MVLSDPEIAALKLGPPKLGLFVRLDTTPPMHRWLGAGPIKVGVNALDADGTVYYGSGEILNLPAFQQLINGAAERVDLSLSGTDPGILNLISMADEVKQKRCDVGFGVFDDHWALLGVIHWSRHYVADYLSMSVNAANEPNSQSMKTAVLSIGSLMTGRRRRGLSYYNDPDQKAYSVSLSSDNVYTPDRSCERTFLYSLNGQKSWPQF